MKKIISIASSILLATSVFANDIDINTSFKKWSGDIPDQIKLNKADEETIESLTNITQEKANEAVNSERMFDIIETLESDAYAERQNQYRSKISAILGNEKPIDNGTNGALLGAQKVIVFVSESMPLKTLRNYARDLEKVGGVMYMRGMIGGLSSVTPTALFSSDVLKIDPSCKTNCRHRNTQILIDPIMFQKYAVNHVPAITVQKDLNVYDYCHNNTDVKINNTVVYGDVSLEYALNYYNDESKDDIEAIIELL